MIGITSNPLGILFIAKWDRTHTQVGGCQCLSQPTVTSRASLSDASTALQPNRTARRAGSTTSPVLTSLRICAFPKVGCEFKLAHLSIFKRYLKICNKSLFNISDFCEIDARVAREHNAIWIERPLHIYKGEKRRLYCAAANHTVHTMRRPRFQTFQRCNR